MTEHSSLATYLTQTIRLKKAVGAGRAAEVTAVQTVTGMRFIPISELAGACAHMQMPPRLSRSVLSWSKLWHFETTRNICGCGFL